MQDKPTATAKSSKPSSKTHFQWDDPFQFEDQLGEEERMIRDTAREFAQDKLAPRVTQAYLEETTGRNLATLDANDFLYQLGASRNYDPSPALERIKAPVMWVNSADDFINPPELRIAEKNVKRLKHGQFILIATSEQTHGHGTHTWAALWKSYLEKLLTDSAHRP